MAQTRAKGPGREDAPELVRRAMAAYLRAGGSAETRFAGSAVEQHDGLWYVVLRDGAELLAVYRVRVYDAVLKRLRRWPGTISGKLPGERREQSNA